MALATPSLRDSRLYSRGKKIPKPVYSYWGIVFCGLGKPLKRFWGVLRALACSPRINPWVNDMVIAKGGLAKTVGNGN